MTTCLNQLPATVVVSTLAATLALTGCGSASSPQSSAPQSSNASSLPKPQPELEFKSPVLNKRGIIPVRYTCGGSNTSLPLSWTHVPPRAAELVVYAVKPIRTPKGSKHRALVQWAIAGLSPHFCQRG